jgi:hypothetical protein
MAERIDARVNAVEPADRQAVLDCTGTEPELQELTAGDDPVLTAGQSGDFPLGRPRGTFPLISRGNIHLIAHRRTVAPRAAPVVR